MKSSIILIGFMGAGKSTIGNELAAKMGVSFIDTDSAIEAEQNMKISEIFEKFGEGRFREIETKYLTKLLEGSFCGIIATGGGIPIKKENRDLLHKIGRVYYLNVDEETVYGRVSGDKNRPLLNTGDLKERIKTLFAQRADIYKETADVLIDAGLEPGTITDIITSEYREWENTK